MAPPVWTLVLLVGAAWGQGRLPAPVSPQFSSVGLLLPHSDPLFTAIITQCDFEDDSKPLCDWTQVSTDDGDWTRASGPSPNGSTGPPGGYPNGEGHYLHMDSSAFRRGGVAGLRSPPIWEKGPLCVHFVYHMFGLSWGTQLKVLLFKGPNSKYSNLLWTHVNTQSPSWTPAAVTVPAEAILPSQLVFEGVRGNTAYMDIALDAIAIHRGSCHRVCVMQACSFDTPNDLCGWSWIPTASGAKWTQRNGSSGVPNVGPQDDFSSPGSGFYMLLDPKNAKPNQKSVLISPLSQSSGCLSLSFHYVLHGQSPGAALIIYASVLGSIRKHTLFSGQPGPNWQPASINYTGQGQIQFTVVGVFGETPEPAVAVDAISITPCGEHFPQCDFEDDAHPFCDWAQTSGNDGQWVRRSNNMPSQGTGATGVPLQTEDHFIYLEADQSSHAGQSFRLVSQPFCAPDATCVEFTYRMYGLGNGSCLTLLLESPAGSSPSSLWHRIGSQSRDWLNASVTIPAGHQQPMQLILEATRGSNAAFVIAVGFIMVHHGTCRGPMPTELPSQSPVSPPGPSEIPVSTEPPMTPTKEPSVPSEVSITAMENPKVSIMCMTVTEKTTVPTRESTTPTGGYTLPTEEHTPTPEIPVQPPEETTTPPEHPQLSPGEQTHCPGHPTLPSGEQTHPPEQPTLTPGEQAHPPEQPTLTPGEQTHPPEQPTLTPGEQTHPPEQPTLTPGEQTPEHHTISHGEQVQPPEHPTLTPGEQTHPIEQPPHPTISLEEQAHLPEHSTQTPREQTLPTEKQAHSPKKPTFSPEKTTEMTTVPMEKPTKMTIVPTEKPTEMTSVPTEKSIIPKEKPTVHTGKPTEMNIVPTEKPTEITTVLTEKPTIPTRKPTIYIKRSTTATEKPIIPTQKPTIPTEKAPIFTEKPPTSTQKPTIPTEKPTIPTQKPTMTTQKPTIPMEKSTISTQKPTVPTEKLTVPMEKPTVPMEKPTVPTEKPTLPTQKPTIPTEKPTIPTEKPTVPTEKPTVPMEKPTVPTEKPIVPREKPIVPTEKPTVPMEKPIVPTEKSTVPTQKPTVPTQKPTVPTQKPTVPTEKPTTSTEKSTMPTEKPTIPTQKPTVPMQKPPVSTEKLTVHNKRRKILTKKPITSTEKPTILIEKPSIPTAKAPTSTEKPTVPTEEPTTSTEKPTVLTAKPPISTEKPTTTTQKPTIPTGKPPTSTEKPPTSTEKPTVHAKRRKILTKRPITSTEKPSIPTAKAPTSTEKPTIPTAKPTIPTEKPSTSTEKPSIPTAKPTIPTEKPSTSTEKPTIPTAKPTIPTEKPSTSREKPTIPTEKPTTSTEKPTVPTEKPTTSTEKPTVPTMKPTTPTEKPPTSTEKPTIPTEKLTVPIKKSTVPTEKPTIPTQRPTVPTRRPTTPVLRPTTLATPEVSSTSLTTVTLATTTPRPIPVSCPPNAHYESCACPASCQNPKPSCWHRCQPGCVCNSGFLFSNSSCIKASSCSCFYNNNYYKVGAMWFSSNCAEHCRCLPGSQKRCQFSQCRKNTVCQRKNGEYGCHPYGEPLPSCWPSLPDRGARLDGRVGKMAVGLTCLRGLGPSSSNPRPPLAGSATCFVYGDPHYLTFDGRPFSFMGKCTYILAQPCGNTTEPFFRVTAKQEERVQEGMSCLSKVHVTLHENTITLLRGRRTMVGGQQATLPILLRKGVYLAVSGRFVELQTVFGLRIRWDGDQQLSITVPSTYSSKLCGFCGNYDGDSHNDNLKPDGTPARDPEELGNSWQIVDNEDKGACLPHITTFPFFDNCMFDMCNFQGLQQMLCSHLSALTETCQEAGYAVKPWRGPQFCPMTCPPNSRYTLCASLCPNTCHPRFNGMSCQERCVEGCECNRGYVLSGFDCVLRSQCGCLDPANGYFKVGEQWYKPGCRELCVCQNNFSIRCWRWKCQAQEVCSRQNGIYGCHALTNQASHELDYHPMRLTEEAAQGSACANSVSSSPGSATCTVSGDPHYLTFDGALHHFLGTCTYTLTRPCQTLPLENDFIVSATNEFRGGNPEVTYVKAVHVQVFKLKISLLKGHKVMLNGLRVTLPVWPAQGRLVIRPSGSFILLHTDFGLQVRYDGNHLVEVTVSSSYAGRLCGLCGNYNNNSLDDNLQPDRKPTNSSIILGAAWMSKDLSEEQCYTTGISSQPSKCLKKEETDPWNKNCDILMNTRGPFSQCHRAVSPKASFSSCKHDQCGSKGNPQNLCRSLQAYAAQCALAGHALAWRNSTFCPLRCPSGSTYSPCASPCPATCLSLNAPRDCPEALPCAEGCECQKGHVLSGTSCVPLSQCGCTDHGGSYHPVGENWYTDRTCSRLCTCSTYNNISCQQSSCKYNHLCWPMEGRIRCLKTGSVACYLSDEPYYVSFDGSHHGLGGNCTYTLVKTCHFSRRITFFKITGRNRKSDNPIAPFSLSQVDMYIYHSRITLQGAHQVLINGTQVELPAHNRIPKVDITSSGNYTVINVFLGIKVQFDGRHLQVVIPSAYHNYVCGLCGNFNAEEEDELMMSSDELAPNDREFVDSWIDEESDRNCQQKKEDQAKKEKPEIHCRQADLSRVQKQCQAALQAPAWANCATRVALEPSLLGCTHHLCEFGGLNHALCEFLQGFEAACQAQGLKPPIWRNSSFCPLECPTHSSYTTCLPSCSPSCRDPDGQCKDSPAPSSCREGCVCQPGFLLSEKRCVPRSECGCRDVRLGPITVSSIGRNHSLRLGHPFWCLYPLGRLWLCSCPGGGAGKTWLTSQCTQSCVCTAGVIQCRPFTCPSGSHCHTNTTGRETCEPIPPRHNLPLVHSACSVASRHTGPCPANSSYTACLPSCLLSCGDPENKCKGSPASFSCREGCVCQPGFVLSEKLCVPRSECGCKDTWLGYIPVSGTQSRLETALLALGYPFLPGRHGSPANALRAVSAQQESFNASPSPAPLDPTATPTPLAGKPVNQYCPANSSYTACMPSCLLSCGDPLNKCDRIQAPSTCREGCVCQPGFLLSEKRCVPRSECGCKDAQLGYMPVSGGRKYTLQCPANSSYTTCTPSCFPMCGDPVNKCDNVPAPTSCLEGCLCRPGFVLSEKRCVPRSECGCRDTHLGYMPARKTWLTSQCTQSCVCTAGVIQCQPFTCPSGSHCHTNTTGRETCEPIPLQCPANSSYTACLPACLPSCQDPHGQCNGRRTAKTCLDGCLCRPGFVFSEKRCVSRSQCGCRDARLGPITAGKTWLTSQCTQSCVCTAGVIQCQPFTCPSGSHCHTNTTGRETCEPIPLQCPANSSYTACMPSCLLSCGDPENKCKGSPAPFSCREGCVCQPGFVLSEKQCVPRSECGCKDTWLGYIPVSGGRKLRPQRGSKETGLHSLTPRLSVPTQDGAFWLTGHCTRRCFCEAGVIHCQSFACPTGTQCQSNSSVLDSCTPKSEWVLGGGQGQGFNTCPDHSSYVSCLPSCLSSCEDPDALCKGMKLPSTCHDGCLCQPGFLLREGKCVLKNQCGCKDSQGSIPEGKIWLSSNCTLRCLCAAEIIRCHAFECPAGFHCRTNSNGDGNCVPSIRRGALTRSFFSAESAQCSVFGDPHYFTFDGFSYRFQGRMTYMLVKTLDVLPEGLEPLLVEGRNKVNLPWTPILHEVIVKIYGYTVQLQADLQLVVNSLRMAIPYRPSEHLGVIMRGHRLYLTTDLEVVVSFDGTNNAVISLPSTYEGLVRGLCGNFDKDLTNELIMPDGTLTQNINVFGNSWEVKNHQKELARFSRATRDLQEEEKGKESDSHRSGCSVEQLALLNSTQGCVVLADPQGPFAACHRKVAPEPFQEHCVFDMCSTWDPKEQEELRCQVLSGYAIICQEAGITLARWRDHTHCALACPANTVYQSCMTPCPASCANLAAPRDCQGPCVEGCASLPGYIYSGVQSLPQARCGCTNNGIYYQQGDSFVTEDCSQRCTCASSDVLLCEPLSCSAGEICTLGNLTWGCFRESPCLENPCQNDGRCREQGDHFICECELGYGGDRCMEPRDGPPPTKYATEGSSWVTVPLGMLVPAVVVALAVTGECKKRMRRWVGGRVRKDGGVPREKVQSKDSHRLVDAEEVKAVVGNPAVAPTRERGRTEPQTQSWPSPLCHVGVPEGWWADSPIASKPTTAVNIWSTSVFFWPGPPAQLMPPILLRGAVGLGCERKACPASHSPSPGLENQGREGGSPPRRCLRLLAEPTRAVRSSCQ
ncbi:Zonadhesin [Galemys pyrenaicus]|uniref:Zonadhesin n=1 Tax=Galemys pyrenaicus TaxID=202257 RepID=A0A8J6BLM2_GALPY|nr:Zonadhesin [Galemys pyrenaicus]